MSYKGWDKIYNVQLFLRTKITHTHPIANETHFGVNPVAQYKRERGSTPSHGEKKPKSKWPATQPPGNRANTPPIEMWRRRQGNIFSYHPFLYNSEENVIVNCLFRYDTFSIIITNNNCLSIEWNWVKINTIITHWKKHILKIYSVFRTTTQEWIIYVKFFF